MTFYSYPPNITVDVDFYNESEKEKLLAYSSAEDIKRLVPSNVIITTSEFLTFYLFNLKKSGKPEFESYEKIRKNIKKSLNELDGFIEFNQNSICQNETVIEQRSFISEYVGETIGLAIISKIHGLIEADWKPIAEQGGKNAQKSFDYQIASDGHGYIQVECKGSSVGDNRKLSRPLYTHKSNIARKKEEMIKLDNLGNNAYPASLRYGTITAVDTRSNGNVKCWLLDPQAADIPNNPRNSQLLTRMRFICTWISFVSPRSQLSAAIATRIAALEKLSDPFDLHEIPLYRARGKSFDHLLDNSAFFVNKSHTANGKSGGVVLQLSDDNLFYIGIREELLTLALSQNFKDILTFKFEAKSLKEDIECVISKGRFRRFFLASSIPVETTESRNYVKFKLQGQIHYSPSGLVFGVLPLN